MSKIDQMCAELRITGDRESLLSDHTDDEKFVWKAFRTKLNESGFNSNDLREHEAEIFLRIRELTECGLLDSEGSSLAWTNDSLSRSSSPKQEARAYPDYMKATAESDTESDHTITMIHSEIDSELEETTAKNGSPHKDSLRNQLPSEKTGGSAVTKTIPNASSGCINAGQKRGSPVQQTIPKEQLRTWHDRKDRAILRGRLSHYVYKEGDSFVAVIDSEKQEVLIPQINLSEADQQYVSTAIVKASPPSALQGTASLAANGVTKEDNLSEIPHDDVEEIKRRVRPVTLVGKRSRPKIRWWFREQGSRPPRPPQSRSGALLTRDLLPSAASKGDLVAVKRLLASGDHIESKGPKSWTETIREADGYNTSKKIRHTYPETTGLYRAAYAGRLEIAHLLIREGADVNTRDGYDGKIGDPILFALIRSGDEKMTRLFVEYGAETGYTGSFTALHIASSHPKLSLVQLLLDHGVRINPKDDLDQTPLYLASVNGFVNIVELLLAEGARTNMTVKEGQSAIYKAAGKGRDDIVGLLLRYGADPAVGRGRHGETSIYKAAWNKDTETVEALLNFEADVNIRNDEKMKSYKGATEKVLHGLLAGMSKGHATMNSWGKTALHAAAHQGYSELVQLLLSAGADVEAAGNDGFTPLYLAATREHDDTMQILLQAGAMLETQKHDPVLARLEARSKAKEGKELTKLSRPISEMARIGTSDVLVALVAGVTEEITSSRRLRHQPERKYIQ